MGASNLSWSSQRSSHSSQPFRKKRSKFRKAQLDYTWSGGIQVLPLHEVENEQHECFEFLQTTLRERI